MTGCDGERSVNVMRVRRSRRVSRVTLHSQCSNYKRLRSTLLWSGHRNLLTPHYSYVICLKDFNRWSFSEFWVQIHVLHFLERSEYKKMSSSSKWGLSSNWSLSTIKNVVWVQAISIVERNGWYQLESGFLIATCRRLIEILTSN